MVGIKNRINVDNLSVFYMYRMCTEMNVDN